MIDVELERGRPFFDIKVVRAPWVDISGSRLAQQPLDGRHAELRSRLVERIGALSSLFGAGGELLLSYQDPLWSDGEQGSGARIDANAWSAALDEAAQHHARGCWLSVADGMCQAGDATNGTVTPEQPGDVATVFRLHIDEQPDALVAVIGLEPSMPDTERGGSECKVTRLVRLLAKDGGRSAPVYLVYVTPRDLLSGGPPAQRLRHFLRGQRASFVLHGGSETSELSRITTRDLRGEEQLSGDMSLVSCPTFKAGEGTPGMARLRLDMANGAINVAFRQDLGPDRPVRPIQVLQPLQSISRVSGAERDLYLKTRALLGDAMAQAPNGEVRDRIAEFERHLKQRWNSDGYVSLCQESGEFPDITAGRESTYRLLALLRERPEGGGYDILLSNHTPLSPPMVARWDTLLLPAFKKPRDLLARLRDDVVRQAVAQTEDLERADRARSFEGAVARILKGEALWSDDVCELANFTTRKVSPSDGSVTDYHYTFVTLKSLVRQSTDGEAQRSPDRLKVIDWLNGLQAVRIDGSPGIALEALESGGAGVRWDPESGLAPRADARQRRRAKELPRGVVWFPLDHEKPLWARCPSIVARNADVMLRLEQELGRHREDGRYPARLLLAAGS